MGAKIMKSLDDLKKLREQLQSEIKIRDNEGIKIIVGMGTCGIAAGAREVMSAFMNECEKRGLNDVSFQQTGCIGMCEKEVLVDIAKPGEPKVTYGLVTPESVARIVAEHIVNGRIIKELVIAKS